MANKIVDKGEGYKLFIYYDVPKDAGNAVAGKTLKDGYPDVVQGQKVVRFLNAIRGQDIFYRYENHPDLLALVEEWYRLTEIRHAEQEQKWQREREAQAAADKPLLDEMNAKVEELRAQIPVDHVEVTVTQTGDLDGWPILEYKADGVTLKWDQVNRIGSASAIRPGALGAFAEVYVASISRERLEEIRAEQAKNTADKAAKNATREKELKETEIPQNVIDLYNEFHGDPDAAYEDEGVGASGAVTIQK
jgi:hypothetical protein